MSPTDPRPRLSVLITVVDGAPAVAGCLDALRAQRQPPSLEILVPWDDTIPEVGALAERYPEARFPALGRLATRRSVANAAGQHELIDQRRTAGLEAARGELVAMLEDRGYPAPSWAQTADRLHRELPHAVIGGLVANGVDSRLNWAVYFIDFAEYQPPAPDTTSAYITDVNVVYKRQALEATRDLWLEGYQETTTHWALAESGQTLWRTGALEVVEHRGNLTLAGLAAERYHWGRLFATTRVREVGLGARAAYAALSPLLPPLLLARIVREQLRGRRTLGTMLRVLPEIVVLLGFKALGEMVGYLTNRI